MRFSTQFFLETKFIVDVSASCLCHIEEHADITTPNIPFQFIVRKRCKDYVDRQLWQSVLIKRENPEINTQLSESVKEGDWIKYTWKLM